MVGSLPSPGAFSPTLFSRRRCDSSRCVNHRRPPRTSCPPSGRGAAGRRGRGRRGELPWQISKDPGGRGRPLGLADCKTGPSGGLRPEAGQQSAACLLSFFTSAFGLICSCVLCLSRSLTLSLSFSSSPGFLTPVTYNTHSAYMEPTCKNIRRVLFLSSSLIGSSSRCRL